MGEMDAEAGNNSDGNATKNTWVEDWNRIRTVVEICFGHEARRDRVKVRGHEDTVEALERYRACSAR